MSIAATCWKLRTREIELPRRPRIMGIVNVTPDSFSDGGEFFDTDRAVAHGLSLVDQGADILDVGGESTRPYSIPVDIEEERQRVLPVIERLAAATRAAISIDTSKPAVARAAVQCGAEIINDVTGFRDEAMIEVAAETQAGVCVMHMQGTPQTMQDNPRYEDAVQEILLYLQAQKDRLQQAGVEAGKICLDPGIGFGKRTQHNLQLIQRIAEFHALGSPLLVGHSRKGFLAKIINDQQSRRAAATLAASCVLAMAGVQVLRVHDVLWHREGLTVLDACRPTEPDPAE